MLRAMCEILLKVCVTIRLFQINVGKKHVRYVEWFTDHFKRFFKGKSTKN